MIVTSKRCFLNVLTQLCDRDTLLKANYYIADQTTPDGTAEFTDKLSYDENGQLVATYAPAQSYVSRISSMGVYNIKYGSGELDPTTFCTTLMSGVRGEYQNPYELFTKHLNQSDTLIATYQFLFKSPPKGNGIQIVVFRDDANLKDFGHIICQYLAQNFGADITFVDPKYRPGVQGFMEYRGDKAYASQLIAKIRDEELLLDFSRAVTQSGYGEGISNLNAHLGRFTFPQLMYLYNLLFPDDPLPPGNYAPEQIIGIITDRALASAPRNGSNRLKNLFMTEDFMNSISRYEREASGYDNDETTGY